MRLGGAPASGPAAAGWGSEETEVFAIHGDGKLWDRYWDGASWHQWETLGSPDGVRLVGQPGAAARDAGHIDVLAIGSDGALWHRWWDGTRWVEWRIVPGAPPGATAVAADWVSSRLDVYVRDGEGELWYVSLEP